MSEAQARWSAFLAKVGTRVDELAAEARAGLHDLVATEVLDPAPLAAALSELSARFMGLTRKVDDAWEKTIEPMLTDAPEAEWNARWRDGEVLRRRIERSSRDLERWALATQARALHQLALDESKVEPACGSCRAPLPAKVRSRTVNVTCAHCRSVTTVRPGLATASFFGGGALHALGVEAAAEAFDALDEADRQLRSRAHSVEADVEAYRLALEHAWNEWARAKARFTPGVSADAVQAEVETKVSQAMASQATEAPRRAARTQALNLAESGNVKALVAWLQREGAKAYFSADDLLECAAEHDSARGLETALLACFAIEAPDTSQREFIAEKRADVLTTIRRRRRG